MFTGIIESVAEVTDIQAFGTNITFTLASKIAKELKIDQSVSHNGVCLTVERVESSELRVLSDKAKALSTQHTKLRTYEVTAIDETLKKTNLGKLKIGNKINLERCMPANGRFDGHIVQGHIDQTGICTGIKDQNGSWLICFEYEESTGNLTVEKGSICINGVSLTVVNSQSNAFSVAIIPYTWENTMFHQIQIGDIVNLEFDIVGKYIKRILMKE
jgi:riboflavin synthase